MSAEMTTLADLSSSSNNSEATTSIASATLPITISPNQYQRLDEPLDNLDALRELLGSWDDDDDDLLTGGGDTANLRLGDAANYATALIPSSSSPLPRSTPHVRVQSPSATALMAPAEVCCIYHRKPTNGRDIFDTNSKASTDAPAKKQRIPRRQEIAQLRDESAVLEKQLYVLSEYWKKNASPEDYTFSAATNLMSAKQAKWKQIAGRQKELLTETKGWNLMLRNEFALQRKNVRHLRRVLMNRTTSPTAFSSALYMLQPRNPLRAFDESRQTFPVLMHATELMLQELNVAAHIIAKRSQLSPTFRDWQVQEEDECDPLNSRFLELVDSYELPFNRLQVNKAMRRFYGEGSQSNSDKSFCEYFQNSGEWLCRQIIYAYSLEGERFTGHVRHREVVRNLSDDTQSVFVSITLIQPVTASGEPIHAVTLRAQKWTIVRAVDTGALATGCAVSIVQTYQKISIESADPAKKAFWTRSMLLKDMAPTWDVSLGSNQRRLETYLVEQSLSDSRRPHAVVISVA